MEIINFTQNLSNINILTIIFLFLPGYIVLRISNYFLEKGKRWDYSSGKITFWEFLFLFLFYSIICYLLVLAFEKGFSLDFNFNKDLSIIFYIPVILFLGFIDYYFVSNATKNSSKHCNIANSINEEYSKKESFVWVSLKNGKEYNGLFLGIDWNDNKGYVKIGSATCKGNKIPIVKKINNKNEELKSKTAIFNLSEVSCIFFQK